MTTSYPAHASPRPDFSSQPGRTISDYNLAHDATTATSSPSEPQPIAQPKPTAPSAMHPPPLVSPAFTPPLTPNGSLDPTTPATSTTTASNPLAESLTDEELDALNQREVEHAASPPPSLTPLPEVTCEVRARIPTTTGQEMFLHLYHNSADNKEHLAIVFGPYIRSKSLDAARPGETEKDRMIRGAYVGTLFPGRTSSRVEALKREAGVPSTPQQQQQQGGVTLPMSPVQAPQRMEGDTVGDEAKADGEGGQAQVEDPTKEPPFVRIHSECYTGETVWSARCDCGEQLDEAARIMSLSPFGGKSEQHMAFFSLHSIRGDAERQVTDVPSLSRRDNLPTPRRPRNRPPLQTQSLQPARSGPRHAPSKPPAAPPGRRAIVRSRDCHVGRPRARRASGLV